MTALAFFAFTTILGWDYYAERSLEYLTDNMKAVMVYRWIYILAVLIGPFLTVSAVWTIADIFNGLMAIPNLIALLALSGVIVAETKKLLQPSSCGRDQRAYTEGKESEKVEFNSRSFAQPLQKSVHNIIAYRKGKSESIVFLVFCFSGKASG